VPGDDYYEVLQVPPDADDEVIQAAYRKLAKQYHPDTGLPGASDEMMKRINEAHATLSDGERRRRYDARSHKARSRAARDAVLRRKGVRILDLAPDLALPLVRVPAGDFLMGGCTDGCDHLARESGRSRGYIFTLPEYYIGVYPVTTDQYAAFAQATGRPPQHALGAARLQLRSHRAGRSAGDCPPRSHLAASLWCTQHPRRQGRPPGHDRHLVRCTRLV